MDKWTGVPFEKTEDGAKLLAIFLVELERAGCAYRISYDTTCWYVAVIGH